MLLIICYDVSTVTLAGQRRLRKVAKTCESSGQRVQKSVFECRLDQRQFEALERKLLDLIKQDEDSLRIYRIIEPVQLHVREYGCFKATNFEGPLLV
jgi:CRISPR-associated protein Cas2